MRYIGLKLMIIAFSVLVLVILSGCAGSDGSNGGNGADGEPCLVEQLEDGVYISCADNDVFIPSPVVEDSDEDQGSSDDSDEVVNCKRGEGHKKHDHTKHEPCV